MWSSLLGVGVTSGKPIPRINTFPGVPGMYLKVRGRRRMKRRNIRSRLGAEAGL